MHEPGPAENRIGAALDPHGLHSDEPATREDSAADEPSRVRSTLDAEHDGPRTHDDDATAPDSEKEPIVEPDLGFCFDPDYRAPEDSFHALERELEQTEIFDDERDIHTTRYEFFQHDMQKHLEPMGLTERGAVAARAYTAHDVFGRLNEALRLGRLTDTHRKQVQAIVSGMNELPRQTGPLVRGIGLSGNRTARDLLAAHYEVGQITVETALTSCSIIDGENPKGAIPGDVELRIDSKTARRLQDIAANPAEREVVLLPGSQLLVHGKELVQETSGKQKWVVDAEEIAPGDPRYLDRAEAEQRMEERRERNRAEAPRMSKDLEAMLSGTDRADSEPHRQEASGNEPDHTSEPDPNDRLSKIERMLDGTKQKNDAENSDGPSDSRPGEDSGQSTDPNAEQHAEGEVREQVTYQGAQELPATGADPHDVPALPLDADGTPDWAQLAQGDPPVTELPALHAGTAHPEHQAAYVADRHPELGEVNPDVALPDAYERGFLTNCTRCVVGYAERLAGLDSRAEPVLPGELAEKGRLDHIDRRLSGEWEDHGGYDSIIERMSREPIGAHAVIGVQYDHGGVRLGHVAMVAHTAEGVAFIDPQTGRLMTLPHPPEHLTLLPFGALPEDRISAGQADSAPDADSRAATADAEPDAAASEPGRHRSSEGPWFGQHTNPLRPSFPVAEDEEREPPAWPESFGGTPSPEWPSAELGETPGTPEVPQPQGIPDSPGVEPESAGPPEMGRSAESGVLPGPGLLSDPSLSAPARFPDVDHIPGSAHDRDVPRLPETPRFPDPADLEAPPELPTLPDFPDSAGLSAGLPDAPGFPDATPADPSTAGGTGALNRSFSGTLDGPSAGAAPLPSPPGTAEPSADAMPAGGAGGAGAAGGSGAEHQPWRPGQVGGFTYERELSITGALATKYLGNDEPSELLTGYGRQTTFRSTAAPDLGPGGFDEFGAGDSAVKLRCDVHSGTNPLLPGEQGALDAGEFTGRAEIVLEEPDGTERLLGTYNSNTQSWTPTPAGRSWLDDPGAEAADGQHRRMS